MQTLQDNELFQTGYLVDGLWKTLDNTFDVINPATGETIAAVAKAGKKETEEAIAAAAKAFPAWRAKTAKERSAILYRWYELIIEHKSWLGRLMTTEQGNRENGPLRHGIRFRSRVSIRLSWPSLNGVSLSAVTLCNKSRRYGVNSGRNSTAFDHCLNRPC